MGNNHPMEPGTELAAGAPPPGTARASRARKRHRLPTSSTVRSWLREPLLHFLVIGAVLFVVYAALNPDPNDPKERRRIVLTENDLSQMTIATLAQGRPAPTIEQMRNLLEAKIREEVLCREALTMGLDKDDIIAKRRMLQKMDFLAEDLSDLREPSRDELQAWFRNNAQRFAYPPRISFRHLYFSFDKHGANTAEAAAAVGGCGVLVSLGGDIATSGPAPAGGWQIRVTDDHRSDPSAPGQTISIDSGNPTCPAIVPSVCPCSNSSCVNPIPSLRWMFSPNPDTSTTRRPRIERNHLGVGDVRRLREGPVFGA